MKELTENPNIIVFIDELHTLVGAGSAEGSLDAANILKPALSRGEIRCIGATTPAEYRKYIEKDRSLERRFQAVKVDPPSEGETIEILLGIKERYESFHHVEYTHEAIEAAVYQSSRYITDRFLPDKAIDLLDEAGVARQAARGGVQRRVRPRSTGTSVWRSSRWRAPSRRRTSSARSSSASRRSWHARTCSSCARSSTSASSHGGSTVGQQEIDEVVSKWTGVPADLDQRGRERQAPAHGGGTACGGSSARTSAISARLARHPAVARRPEGPDAPGGQLRLPRAPRASARPNSPARWPTSCSAAITR